MKKASLNSESTLPGVGGRLRSVLFFVLFYLFLVFYVDLRLLYYVTGTTVGITGFRCELSCLLESLSVPGGVVRYVSVLVTQFFMFRWAGPVVVVLQAWLMALCIDRIVVKCEAKRFVWLRYVPGIVLLFFYTSYVYHFEVTLAMLVVLLLFNLYLTINSEKWQVLAAWFAVLAIIAYYFAAAGSLLFVVMCGVYELAVRNRGGLGVWCLLSGAAVGLLVGVYGFGMSHVDAYSELMPWSWRITKYDLLNKMVGWLYGMLLCVPICVMLTGFFKLSRRDVPVAKRKSRKISRAKDEAVVKFGGVFFRWIGCTAVLLGVAVGGVFHFSDGLSRTLYSIEYHRGEGDWEKVVELADNAPLQLLSMQARNHALYRLGRFGDELFNYRQHTDGLMLSHAVFENSYWHKYDLYLDLGLVGQTDELLTESMVAFRDNPYILKRLAMVNMISGKNETARVYLGALRKRLFFGEWAREYLAKLESDPELKGDAEIQRLRRLIPQEKGGRFLATSESQLIAQIENGGMNKMALEYLLAFYMLRGELWNFVEVVGRMEDHGYQQIPIAFEEAILLNNKFLDKKISFSDLKVRAETKRRFDEFMALTLRYRTKTAAQGPLASKFKNTYMYYYFYGKPE